MHAREEVYMQSTRLWCCVSITEYKSTITEKKSMFRDWYLNYFPAVYIFLFSALSCEQGHSITYTWTDICVFWFLVFHTNNKLESLFQNLYFNWFVFFLGVFVFHTNNFISVIKTFFTSETQPSFLLLWCNQDKTWVLALDCEITLSRLTTNLVYWVHPPQTLRYAHNVFFKKKVEHQPHQQSHPSSLPSHYPWLP